MDFNWNNIPSYINAFSGISLIDEGIDTYDQAASAAASAGDIAIASAANSASSLRQAGISSVATANYNIGLNTVQTNRQLDTIRRNSADAFSTQRGQMAKSGVAITSRSFLADFHTSLSTVERNLVRTINDSNQRASILDYEGKLAQVNYENQAKAAEYQGVVQKYNAEVARASAEAKADMASSAQIGNIGKTIGNLLSEF